MAGNAPYVANPPSPGMRLRADDVAALRLAGGLRVHCKMLMATKRRELATRFGCQTTQSGVQGVVSFPRRLPLASLATVTLCGEVPERNACG